MLDPLYWIVRNSIPYKIQKSWILCSISMQQPKHFTRHNLDFNKSGKLITTELLNFLIFVTLVEKLNRKLKQAKRNQNSLHTSLRINLICAVTVMISFSVNISYENFVKYSKPNLL